MNRHVRAFLKKAAAIVTVAAVLGGPQAAWAVTITGFDTPLTTNFNGWNGTLPAGFAMTGNGAVYRGTTAGTTGGVYAIADSGFGWQASSSATAISLTGTFTNNTGSLIEGITLSYDAFQIVNRTSRTPGWTVTSSLGTVSDLNWVFDSSKSAASPAQPSLTLAGLNIAAGTTFTLTFASDRGADSGSSPLIGLNNIAVTATGSGGGGGGANAYWVGADTTLGGAGTWTQTGGTAWRTTDTDGVGEAWDSTKIATFGGASSGTVTVTDTVTANAGLSFATSGYTLTGGTVSLGGANAAANTITTDAATAIAVNSVITGSTGLTKAGTGTLTLGGANTYTGGTTVSAGTLVGTTSSLQGAITNSAAVTFDQAAAGTYAGIMSGSGTLTKLGSGNVTLTGANTYAGGTTVSAGTLTVGNAATAGSIATAGSVELAAAGRLAFDRSDTVSFTGSVTGSGTLAQIGSGTLTLSRSTAYGADFTLRVENGTVDLNRAGSPLVGILGTGNTVTLAGGTLQLTSNSGEETKFENAAIDVQASSAIVINRTGTAANHSTTGFSAPITVSNGATLAFDYAGVIGSGFKGTTTYSAPVTLASNATFSVTNSAGGTAEVIFSNAVGDGGAGYGLTKTGPERLTLSGANTYSGGTTINAGTLSVAADAALGDAGGGITLGGGTLELTSGFTLGSGRTITAAAATSSTIAVTSGTVSFAGPFTGSGSLDKAGAGTLSVGNASSTYTGSFTISAGTLEVTAADAFANAMLTQTGGTLLLAPQGGGDVVIPEIGGSGGEVSVDAGASAVFRGNSDRAYGGRIRGQGAFKKEGNGILTLNADNDFVGNTRIAQGRLKLGANGALSATPRIDIDSGAIFDVADKSGFALGTGQRLGGRGTVLGDLQFGGGSQIAFDASGPLLVGSGTVSFASGFGIGSIFGLDTSVAEGTYTLLDETTGGAISFANLANVGPGNPFDLGGGKSAYFQQGSLQVVVVPEPDAFLLGGLGLALAGLVLGRRRGRVPNA